MGDLIVFVLFWPWGPFRVVLPISRLTYKWRVNTRVLITIRGTDGWGFLSISQQPYPAPPRHLPGPWRWQQVTPLCQHPTGGQTMCLFHGTHPVPAAHEAYGGGGWGRLCPQGNPQPVDEEMPQLSICWGHNLGGHFGHFSEIPMESSPSA